MSEMAIPLSRRELLQFGFAAATTWPLVDFAQFGKPRIPVERPFAWNDAFRRSEVESVVASPNGTAFAVEVIRPLSAEGLHAGWPGPAIHPRGQIWLLDERLQSQRCLDPKDLWHWAPSFSPCGTQLAALISRGNGRAGLAIWKLSTNERMEIQNINVDLYVKFSFSAQPQSKVAAIYPSLKQYTWINDQSILFVEHGESPAQFEQAIQSAPETYSRLRRLTANGITSVRVWDQDAPTCGVGRRLAKLDCSSGHVTTIYEGDIRGVSVAPCGRWIAALVATGHIRYSAERPMEPALRFTSVGDDSLVELRTVRIDLHGEVPARVVPGFLTVGNASPARLPVWDADSQRFTLPARTIYSSAYSTDFDSCWEVQNISLTTRTWKAHSALDSELLASLIASLPESCRENGLIHRPSVAALTQRGSLGGGQINGAAWRYGNSYVLLWVKPKIILIGPDGTTDIPGDFSNAYAPISKGDKATAVAVRSNGSFCEIYLTATDAKITEKIMEPGWNYLATRVQDGAIIAKKDSSSGTSIAGFLPVRPPIVSSLHFNSHFQGIAQPQIRKLSYRDNDGQEITGLLQLPIGRAQNGRHPVILWAYPDQDPFAGTMTQPNSAMAVHLPFQYLLTRGFAVFHAPLNTTQTKSRTPLEMTTHAVLLWLDVLDHQPEIIPGEYGFFGHSNAGYVALALEVSTSRFKCIVASSTFPDLGTSPLASSLDIVALNCAGQVLQADRRYYEDNDQPYTFGAPFWEAEEKFIQNSPLYRMGNATTPLLLIEGEFDFSPREMESVYSILDGRGIPVQLAYYWGEGHVINSPGNIKNTWERTEQFFRKYMRTI